ncbi:MAG: murein biosynthesis integral membrane protein MurJ [Planctomycetota bacterium]
MSVIRSARTVSGGTLLSRGLGLVRDTVLAHFLGAGAVADAFAIAFRVPNLLREIVGEGALTSAFLPSYAGRVAAGDESGARRLFRTTLTLLTATLLVVTIGVSALLLAIPADVFPSEDPGKVRLILDLCAWCLPYAPLVCAAALFAAALQAEGRFGIPALAPAAMNAGWIAGMLIFIPLFADDHSGRGRAVAAAVLLGGVLQAAIALPTLRRLGLPLLPGVDLRDPALKGMLGRMLPAVLGLAPVQVNLFVNTMLAEAFVPGDGANSALYYSARLLHLPIALVGISVAVASFPLFSRLHAEGRRADLGHAVAEALRTVTFLAFPAAAGLAIVALPLASLLFGHGAYTAEDAEATAAVLHMGLIGLPAFCALQTLTRSFHAQGDTSTPVRIGARCVALAFSLNLLLVGPMEERGLALATAVTAWVNAACLAWCARRHHRLRGLRTLIGTVARTLPLTAASAAAAWGTLAWASSAWTDPGLAGRLVLVVAPVIAGALAFAAPAIALDVREARELRDALRTRA